LVTNSYILRDVATLEEPRVSDFLPHPANSQPFVETLPGFSTKGPLEGLPLKSADYFSVKRKAWALNFDTICP
jgi:hypothetical protein